MNLELDVSWPATLPLPKIDFSGVLRNSTLASPPESAAIARRSRFQRVYSTLSVAWVLTPAQNAIFSDFFLNDLGNGTAQFQIELLYPSNSVLTWWAARFGAGYQASYDDGFWTIQASLELVNPVAF